MSSFIDIVRPSSRSQRIVFDLLCVVGGSLFLALLSQPIIHLWFTPIPITLQSLGVMLIGAILGSKRGAFSVLLYLFEGGVGLPFFGGGSHGLLSLLGPCGGYFFSFILAAYLTGWLLERGWKNNYQRTCAALCLATVVILAGGALWLSLFVGISQACALGVYPFVIGNILQIIVAAALIPSGWKLIRHYETNSDLS